MSDEPHDPGRDETDGSAERDRRDAGDESAEPDHRAFWADEVADRIEARDPSDPIVVKGGISPSGVPHLGNLNEIMRGYFVAEVLRERGHEVRQVFTTDDRDPLRKVPRTLADLNWNVVGLGEVDAGALGRNLGKPYTDIPDPFDCCDSYGDHFSALIERSAAALGVPIEIVSTTELYESGEFDDAVRTVLEHRDLSREVLSAYQEKVDEEYVPFNPICANCGTVTETVLSVDLDAGTVEYECTDVTAGDRTIEGCGHRGTATFREGKLPWRFEWPAEWQVLEVDFEPFGKDHAEGSWPSGQEIAREVFETEPPEPMVYEWFTLGGEPFSSSSGNVVTVDDVLSLVELEVVRYFFALAPGKQRDLDLDRIDRLVDEFDRFESLFAGEVEDPDHGAFAERAYPFVLPASSVPRGAVEAGVDAGVLPGDAEPVEPTEPADPTDPAGMGGYDAYRRFLREVFRDRVRFPYTFAAVLGMTDDPDLRGDLARRAGHLSTDTPDWAAAVAMERVPLARTWAERTDNEYNYRLAERLPDTTFDEATAAALDDLAAFVAAGHDGDAIQGEVYEVAERHDVPVGEFFSAGYRLFLDEESGPRLGPFLAALDREFVVQRLRREA